MKRIIIFDMDGTLYRTDLSYVASVREVLERHGAAPPPADEIMSVVGEPLGPILDWLAPYGDPWELRREIFDLDLLNIRRRGALYPGVPETLARLREAGWRLAVCTNGSENYVKTIVEHFGLAPYFEVVRYPLDGEDKTRMTAEILERTGAREGWMVGDRRHDIEAARRSGLAAVGAAYGYGGAEAEEADYVIREIGELPELVG